MSYIQDARTPKDAWGNLKKIITASTTATKLQLRHELRNVRLREMTVADYTSKIKEIDDSVDVNVIPSSREDTLD